MDSLFSQRPRSEREPKRPGETHYAFLDRIDSRFFAAVRATLDAWFRAYPSDDRARLQREFSGSDLAHESSFFELYLHETYRRLGFEVERDPPMPSGEKRPDFLLRDKHGEAYLEATVARREDAEVLKQRRARDNVVAILNEVRSPDFGIRLEIKKAGTQDPRRRPLIQDVETWLAGLDPDQHAGAVPHGFEDLPQKDFRAGEWLLEITAIALKPSARGNVNRRALGVFPLEGGVIDSLRPLRNSLKAKAGRYGEPDRSYLIAINWLDQFAARDELTSVLWGSETVRVNPSAPEASAELVRQPDGFFWRGKPDNRRVSGVFSHLEVLPWSVSSVEPVLCVNPWAKRPLRGERFPWEVETVDTDSSKIGIRSAQAAIRDVLDLPEDWPPGQPFRSGDHD